MLALGLLIKSNVVGHIGLHCDRLSRREKAALEEIEDWVNDSKTISNSCLASKRY